MTRLRIVFLVVAVMAGAYAGLMLIGGQLIHFGVAAGICAGSSLLAALIAYVDYDDARRQHQLPRRYRAAVRRGQAAIRKRSQQQAATAAGSQCPLCGGTRQKRCDSTKFADRQDARFCQACAPFTA